VSQPFPTVKVLGIEDDVTSFDTDELASALARLLEAAPGQFAPALAATLKVPKGTINPVLYNDPRFIRSDEAKPRWFLATQAGLVDAVATTKSVMQSGLRTT